MVRNSLVDSTLETFFFYPTREFGVRELARESGVAHPTILRHLKLLEHEGLVIQGAHGFWKALGTKEFKQAKRIKTISLTYQSGLVDYLNTTLLPNSIILFGSGARGEDNENSDIDIFVEAPQKNVSLKKFETKFKRKINLTFGKLKTLNKEFLNSVLNGVLLEGGIEIDK